MWLFSLGYCQIPNQLLPHSSSSTFFLCQFSFSAFSSFFQSWWLCACSHSPEWFASGLSSSSFFNLLQWVSFPHNVGFQEQKPLLQALHGESLLQCLQQPPSLLPPWPQWFHCCFSHFCSLPLCLFRWFWSDTSIFSGGTTSMAARLSFGQWALEPPEFAPYPAQMGLELVILKERTEVQPLSYMCSFRRSWYSGDLGREQTFSFSFWDSCVLLGELGIPQDWEYMAIGAHV